MCSAGKYWWFVATFDEKNSTLNVVPDPDKNPAILNDDTWSRAFEAAWYAVFFSRGEGPKLGSHA